MAAADPQAEIPPVPPQLPEPEFWEKYNDRLEFPLSTVGAVFLHVLVAVLLFLVMSYLVNRGADKTPVPITFIDVGGDDLEGQGSEGSGGDEIVGISGSPLDGTFDAQPTNTNTPTPQANPYTPPDPKGLSSNPQPSAFEKTGPAIQSQQTGGKQGTGNQGGVGGEGRKGSGPGGSGNDATRARQKWARWVLSFSTFDDDGRDYLNQLGVFGATLVVPRPGDNEYLVYDDIVHNTNVKTMKKADAERAYSTHLWFSEEPGKYTDAGRRATSQRRITDVVRALKLDFTPEKFMAVFPKELEGALDAKEDAFLQRLRAETRYATIVVEDVQATVFAVDRQKGGREVEVTRMQLKDGTRIEVRNGRIIVGGR